MTLYPLLAYINYWLRAVDAHSLHSPFLFDFYSNVIAAKETIDDQSFLQLRSQLLKNQQKITINELGAGSRVTKNDERKISEIARHSSTPPKFSRFLHRLIRYYQFENVWELGTSLGINTLYLANAHKIVHIKTFEGAEEITKLASQNFEAAHARNIQLIKGNIDETLPRELEKTQSIDLVYLDANHRFEPTIRYVRQLLPKLHENSILVLDDIHWSKEMNEAWKKVQAMPEVTLTLDLYEAGLVFFKKNLEKREVILRF